jgi:hypothetical protein
MRKKFFVTDSFVDMHRSAALHMLYLECKFAVVSGQYLTTLEHALQARRVRHMAVYVGHRTLSWLIYNRHFFVSKISDSIFIISLVDCQ